MYNTFLPLDEITATKSYILNLFIFISKHLYICCLQLFTSVLHPAYPGIHPAVVLCLNEVLGEYMLALFPQVAQV